MKTTIEIADRLPREAKQPLARDGMTLRDDREGFGTVVAGRRQPVQPYQWMIKPFRGEGLTDEFKTAVWSKIRNAAYGLPDGE